ncbi:DeoR family transcriptional regulator [Thioclava sp. SK-1]|uniref:DeoR/GlpR family DNA-binding transcription regulator n=1 Tax=Thioclava sp. SK-1 TaxID=1889770 RepID=UPI0008260E0A|nr:DeoR/GlpR family DNA-binding transcription regulator [Thioclava sp. SK-1]OCX67256.1 DeoR family transcriptional regulator [Thioclava sp. SK-1]
MKPASRRDDILSLINEFGSVQVDILAERFQTSRETIRRDLTELDAAGAIRKVHGGAKRALPPSVVLSEGAFEARMAEQTVEKALIGRAAAALFDEGSVIFVDTGSTTIAFARALARRRGVTVITNSPEIAGVLARAEAQHRVYLLGGEVAAKGQETLGALAVEQLERFKAEHVVLTVGAVTHSDIMDYDLRETEMARAMIARAHCVTVLADYTKLCRAAVFDVAALKDVDRLVTDRAPQPDMAQALQAAGVEVIIATS